LDGVFTSYPKCWLEFIEAKRGKHFQSLEEAKKSLSYADYVNLKNDYRSSDFKYNLTPTKGSSAFTSSLKEQGWFLVIATTRPASHPGLQTRTVQWLEKNGIYFDDLLFIDKGLDILTRYPDFIFGVQDDPEVCNIMAKMGYRMFLMRDGRNFGNLHQNIVTADTLEDIIRRVANWT
jgi:hypothetical protein